jgi:hypothetical protein
MNFKKVNNLTGWAVFLIAFATYFLTREARGSLWDCGEFVASADKVQLPHPPGAPLFVLLGRFFIILFGDNNMTAANAVNFMSALASAATILFLFWSITHFARKMFVTGVQSLDASQTFTVMAAGAVGALAYTFSDSFWFSAVEGEVYALSSFFTALVFWCMLKWEQADVDAQLDPVAKMRSDRWIVFLFFMMGLSIGVHILNLLSIPAIVMVYYYRRYNVSMKGAILAFLVGCIMVGVVQVGVIQFSMKAAGQFDVFFVNRFGMPFFSGFAIYFLMLAALIGWAITFNERNFTRGKKITWFVLFLLLSLLPFIVSTGSDGVKVLKFLLVAGVAALIGYFMRATALRVLKLSLWCYAFMMIGYFMYFTALIRSNANPAIDMNNVDNPINLVYYLSREQYGEAPLVYGPHFAAEYNYGDDGYVIFDDGEEKYVKGKDSYIPIGKERKPTYNSADMQLFPRIWDNSNDQGHADFYATWLNLGKYQDPRTGRERYESPTFGDNMEWLFTYQMSLMYWRYFMWNFGGKQNDVQGLGNKRDGNWISGISFIDNARLGDQSKMPDSLTHNKAHNQLYMLPFILGILGCVYQFLRNKQDWVVSFLLFFMTGLAVVFYLNQPGNQPRERDYAYVGSFYAFAIWIGLAVVAFVRLAREKADKLTFSNTLIYGSVLTFVVTAMSTFNDTGSGMLTSSLLVTAMYAAVVTAVTMILRAVSSQGNNARILNLTTAIVCLIVPLLMAQQEWDDHDRSKKTLAPDMARDYLESCAPNAILFTFGDNDTYPLWYAQEVEGVRPDIRIINNSLLGIDWYINQLRRKVNGADGVDVIWSEEQIEGHNREYLRYRPQGDKETFYNLFNIMKTEVGKPSIDPATGRDVGPSTFPVSRFFVPVDTALVRQNGTVNATDPVSPMMKFEISEAKLQDGLIRSDLIILNIIAANNWKRPIYFTAPYGSLGFGSYLRKDGLTYRLVPFQSNGQNANWLVNTFQRDNNLDAMSKNMLTKFVFDSKHGTYFDEENRRHALNLRNTYGEIAGNLADAGRKDEALKLLDKCEKLVNSDDLPYGMTSRDNGHNIQNLSYLEACYKAGNMTLAAKVKASIQKDLEQQHNYYEYLKTSREDLFAMFDGRDGEAIRNEYFLQLLGAMEQKYNAATPAKPNSEGLDTIMTKPVDTPRKN